MDTKTRKIVRETMMGGVADQTVVRGDEVTVRKSFFYRHGGTAESFEAKVIRALSSAGVKFQVHEMGEHNAAFKGGAPIAKQSHWFVKFVVLGLDN